MKTDAEIVAECKSFIDKQQEMIAFQQQTIGALESLLDDTGRKMDARLQNSFVMGFSFGTYLAQTEQLVNQIRQLRAISPLTSQVLRLNQDDDSCPLWLADNTKQFHSLMIHVGSQTRDMEAACGHLLDFYNDTWNANIASRKAHEEIDSNE